MTLVVHYVGGPRDGDIEPCAERPPHVQRQWLPQGRTPVDYVLSLVEIGPSASALVYATSWLPDHVVHSVVAARLRFRENDSIALTHAQRDDLRRHLPPQTGRRTAVEFA